MDDGCAMHTDANDMVSVYRIEDAFGIGVFQSAGLSNAMNEAMTGNGQSDWHADRALPSSLEIFGHHQHLVCGVDNLRDLVRWFPRPMRRVIARSEYGLTVYRMPAAAVMTADGAMQVMFDTEQAVSSEQVAFGGGPAKTFDWLDQPIIATTHH